MNKDEAFKKSREEFFNMMDEYWRGNKVIMRSKDYLLKNGISKKEFEKIIVDDLKNKIKDFLNKYI